MENSEGIYSAGTTCCPSVVAGIATVLEAVIAAPRAGSGLCC